MNTTTRTAPAASAQAVATIRPVAPRRCRDDRPNRAPGTEPRRRFDYGPISRAEMRAIVAEMIG